MRKVFFLLLFVPGVLQAQSGQEAARTANGDVSGRWVVNTDFYGSTIYFRMELKQQGEKLSGNFDGDKLEGTLKGNSIYLLAKDEQGGTDEGKGTLEARPSPGPLCLPTQTMLRIRRRTSLRQNSFRRGARERRSGMNLCPPLFTVNS